MMSVERHRIIEELVNKKGFATIAELAEDLNVSESTVRRDIDFLEKENKLLRSHGGVVQMQQTNINLVIARENSNVNIKRNIGDAAAQLVKDGDSIFLDSSTTVLEIARNLKNDVRITAVTNDLTIALELEKKPNINTIVLGGTLRAGTHSLIGAIADSNLKGMYFSKTFMGAGGVSIEGHIMNYNLEAIEFRKKVISVSDSTILAVDSSKFNKKGFSTVASFDMLEYLITNEIPQDLKAFIESKGVRVILSK